MKLTYLTTSLVLFQSVQVGHATNFVNDNNFNIANRQSIVGRLKSPVKRFDYDGLSIPSDEAPLPLKDSLIWVAGRRKSQYRFFLYSFDNKDIALKKSK